MANVAVILAAGSGTRMGHDIPKQFLMLDGKPVLGHTLQTFEACDEIERIVIVSAPDWLDKAGEVAEAYAPVKCDAVVPGGATRQESSALGLSALAAYSDETILLVHDAVRPFVTHDIIARCIQAVREHGAADVVVPAVDTIVQGEQGFITSMPDRKTMFQGQTPQGFRLGLIRQAHARARREGFTEATDDVRLVMRLGHPVQLVTGSYENIKLTHPSDIALADMILARRQGAAACR